MKNVYVKSCLAMFLALSVNVFSQSGSSVQFWDTTGTKETAKFGWSGDEATGKFYIETPQGGEVLSVKGSAVKTQSVEAESFKGDGSELTGVIKDGQLSDSLAKRALKKHTHAADSILSAGSVKGVHLGDTAVGTAKIKDGAVTDAKIKSVSANKLTGKMSGANMPDAFDSIKAQSVEAESFKGDGSALTGVVMEGQLSDSLSKRALDNHTHAADSILSAGSVKGVHLGDTAVGTAKIKDGAVTDAKVKSVSAGKLTGKVADTLLPVATGGNYRSITPNTGYYISDSWKNYYSVSINAPTDGYVIVFASAKAVFHGMDSTMTDGPVHVEFEIIHGSGSVTSGHPLMLKEPGDQDYFTIQKGFPVKAGGNTFYFASKCNNGKSSYAKADDIMLSAIFFKAKMGY